MRHDDTFSVTTPRCPGLFWRRFSPQVAFLMFWLTALPAQLHAVSITSGPVFIPSTNAPLSGLLQVTTDSPSRISVSVDDGTSVWSRQFYDFGTSHSEPLFGFHPDRTNQINVTVYDGDRNSASPSQPLLWTSDRLPTNFPTLNLLQSNPAKMEPGYTLFRVELHNGAYTYVVIVDNAGSVVWYANAPTTADVRQLANGNLFMPATNSFFEMNLLGQTVNNWLVPTNMPIDIHDGVPTSHGSILFLSDATRVVSGFPTSMTVPDAPVADATLFYQPVVELSVTNATVLNTWNTLDLLDPRRISYLIFQFPTRAWDIQHANAVIEDPSDNSIIVSLRNQNAIIKISRATGQLVWIFGPHDGWGPQWQPYLLAPVGSPFVWPYGAHSPVLTPRGTLMVYDDGNSRAMPFAPPVADTNNYSRAAEFRINEQTMEVTQVWDYGRTNVSERIFTPYEGSAEPLPKTGNVLICFPAITEVNGVPPSSFGPTATMARIKEVTYESPPEVVFDLALSAFDKLNYKDLSIYRSLRIPDLYGHPAAPVSNLSVRLQNGAPLLRFSADGARTYTVQASTNLVDWSDLGAPAQVLENGASIGDFDFQDTALGSSGRRFYRVVTH